MTLRPVLSFFSFYWGTWIYEDEKSLRWNLMCAHAISLFPFLFVPLFPKIGFLIFASAVFTLFYRAESPALMEIIRRNLDKNAREASFSIATTAAYIEGILLAVFTGWMIEHLESGWIYLFPAYATIGLFGLYFQAKLKILPLNEPQATVVNRFSFVEPLKIGISLLKKNREFLQFQIGYFFCGGGLMLSMPAIPNLLTGSGFCFTTLFTSTCAVKELGMIFAAPLWGLLMKKTRYEFLSGIVFSFVALFLGLLQMLNLGIAFLFVAYFVYGIAQAGSHLIWNLSGPYFSKDQESSRYTMVNVFMVGARGLLMPLLGGWICDTLGAKIALTSGVVLSLAGTLYVCLPIRQLPVNQQAQS
jgi:MFS family permease